MGKNSAYTLILAVLGLVSIGLVTLTSVGAFSPYNHGDSYYFFKQQSIFIVAAFVLCMVAAKWDYHHWIKFAPLVLVAGLVLMTACFLPKIGVQVNGANRWLNLGVTRIQPVEIAKFGLLISLAWWFGQKVKEQPDLKSGVLVPLCAFGAVAVLCGAQKDYGTAALMLAVTFLVMFVAGVKLRYILPFPVVGLTGIILIALATPAKAHRFKVFLDPEKYKFTDEGLQIWNALVAFGSGGISGRGLGEGIQKMKYLPESHTDFIFPNIGEELGVICTLMVVFLFLLLVASGGVISFHAKDRTGMLVGIGATALIGLQGLMNMAVVTSLIPNKGINLPFISYGGSNLLLCFLLIGILLNVHFQADYGKKKARPASMSAAMTARM
jgi:cell division protein FtsW